MKSIILIGMPGAGKSTIGVLLAKSIGLSFIDTDIIIQQKEGKLLQDIIETFGIKSFLEAEENAVLGMNVKNCVIATGGSVVYSSMAMEFLKKSGIVIYLKLKCEEIEERVRNISSRGIAMEKGQSLCGLFSERAPLYEEYADITVDCSHRNIEQIVSLIKENVLD